MQNSTPVHPRFVHGAAADSDSLMDELEVRKQQIGQLELAAATTPYYSMAEYFRGQDVVHWIDNTAALSGLVKGYSAKPDSARIIHAFHALNVPLQANVWFEYVRSAANIADFPSRGQFAMLKDTYGSAEWHFQVPPIAVWLSPELAAAAGELHAPKRGGKRGR